MIYSGRYGAQTYGGIIQKIKSRIGKGAASIIVGFGNAIINMLKSTENKTILNNRENKTILQGSQGKTTLNSKNNKTII